MANVKFYKLNSLPSFAPNSHTGIFVHIPDEYTPTANTIVKSYDGGSNFDQTDNTTWGNATYFNGTEKVFSGLWFGGKLGWEFLTNVSNEDIRAWVDNNLNSLSVATVLPNEDSTTHDITLTLTGVKTQAGIATAGVATDYTGGAFPTVTIGNGALTVSGNNGNGTATSATLITANQTGNNNLVFDDTSLKFIAGSVSGTAGTLSVLTQTATSSTNKIATMADISAMASGMHFKGALASDSNWPSSNISNGDVYVVTTGFTHSTDVLEVGDMVVFRVDDSTTPATTSYNVVQANLQLGIGQGQIAVNSAALTNGNLVKATATGIETTNIDPSSPASRTLIVSSGTPDSGSFYHDATARDEFSIFGVDYTRTLKISSPNPSVEVKKGSGDTEVAIDLVWQTAI